MKKLSLILFLILATLTSFAQSSKLEVAVYCIGKDVSDAIVSLVSSNILTEFASKKEITAVERTPDFISALNSEIESQQSGIINPAQIARIGNQLGADYVCAINLSMLLDELYASVKVINVSSGEVTISDNISQNVENAVEARQFANQIAKKIIDKYEEMLQSSISASNQNIIEMGPFNRASAIIRCYFNFDRLSNGQNVDISRLREIITTGIKSDLKFPIITKIEYKTRVLPQRPGYITPREPIIHEIDIYFIIKNGIENKITIYDRTNYYDGRLHGLSELKDGLLMGNFNETQEFYIVKEL